MGRPRLRRTLSDLIVDLSAVAELRRGDVSAPTPSSTPPRPGAGRDRRFTSPRSSARLLIDTGNPFRAAMLA